jgi:hypothetical protein
MKAELSEFAKTLLKEAAQSGGAFIINEMIHELRIELGSRPTLIAQEAREKAEWKETIRNLESEGLIRLTGGHRYELTPLGFTEADKP